MRARGRRPIAHVRKTQVSCARAHLAAALECTCTLGRPNVHVRKTLASCAHARLAAVLALACTLCFRIMITMMLSMTIIMTTIIVFIIMASITSIIMIIIWVLNIAYVPMSAQGVAPTGTTPSGAFYQQMECHR